VVSTAICSCCCGLVGFRIGADRELLDGAGLGGVIGCLSNELQLPLLGGVLDLERERAATAAARTSLRQSSLTWIVAGVRLAAFNSAKRSSCASTFKRSAWRSSALMPRCTSSWRLASAWSSRSESLYSE
jgi:hypothetical protein